MYATSRHSKIRTTQDNLRIDLAALKYGISVELVEIYLSEEVTVIEWREMVKSYRNQNGKVNT